VTATAPSQPATLPITRGALVANDYRSRSIREELRANLVDALRSGRELFNGVVGYDNTVIPAIINAILAGQDILFLGERGQAKTRLARSLTSLLDEWVPVLSGTDIPDDPVAPVTRQGRRLVDEFGDNAPVHWLHRSERFAEKLATPDTSIADLIGEIDPIKIAEGRYLTDEEALSPGLIPASNRSIFNLNELPDLSERIQVGLLNILEEQDVQIRGFRMQLPVDVFIVASANPEDYTNRGRIITPLKDRFGSQVRTHYPHTAELEMRIADQERERVVADGVGVAFPEFMKRIIATATRLARESDDISKRSGVSVRASIANFELAEASAVQRALRNGESWAAPRVSDLDACVEPTIGKLEFEHFGSRTEADIVRELFGAAVHRVFAATVTEQQLAPIEAAFQHGLEVDISLRTPSQAIFDRLSRIPGVAIPPEFGSDPSLAASWFELVLEGLVQHRVLEREALGDAHRYASSRG
jgi:magnesium chelatase subunit I